LNFCIVSSEELVLTILEIAPPSVKMFCQALGISGVIVIGVGITIVLGITGGVTKVTWLLLLLVGTITSGVVIGVVGDNWWVTTGWVTTGAVGVTGVVVLVVVWLLVVVVLFDDDELLPPDKPLVLEPPPPPEELVLINVTEVFAGVYDS
jgi:hypothetical protein